MVSKRMSRWPWKRTAVMVEEADVPLVVAVVSLAVEPSLVVAEGMLIVAVVKGGQGVSKRWCGRFGKMVWWSRAVVVVLLLIVVSVPGTVVREAERAQGTECSSFASPLSDRKVNKRDSRKVTEAKFKSTRFVSCHAAQYTESNLRWNPASPYIHEMGGRN